jgi:hypothetical protein
VLTGIIAVFVVLMLLMVALCTGLAMIGSSIPPSHSSNSSD